MSSFVWEVVKCVAFNGSEGWLGDSVGGIKTYQPADVT